MRRDFARRVCKGRRGVCGVVGFTGLERFEERLFLSSVPIGYVDVLSRTQVVGWAFNADTGANPINVRITVDATATTVVADASRPDLQNYLGSSNHGYYYTVPTLGPGAHTIKVEAINPNSGQAVALGGGTVTNPAPIGSVDIFTDTSIVGWAFDEDAGASPVTVRVDVNGSTASAAAASGSRPDLVNWLGSGNHGFSFTGSFGSGVVEVVALDVPSGAPVILRSNNASAIGYVDVADQFRVAGWAFDPNRGSAAIGVRVVVDGTSVGTVMADIERVDLIGAVGSSGHGFNFNLPALSPGEHKVEVFALDPDTLVNTDILIGTKTVVNPPPLGWMDIATRNAVAGWVADLDSPGTSLAYEVRLDENVSGRTATVIASGVASNERPDLVPWLGVGNGRHGFSVTIAGLSAGPHRLSLYGADSPSGIKTLIHSVVIDNTLPIGSLDIADIGMGIMGWVYDSDPNGPASARLFIDGVQYDTVVATVSRPDLASWLGTDGRHGYVFATPTLSFGEHTVQVYAVDSFTEEAVLVGTKRITNRTPLGYIDVANTSMILGWAFDFDAANNGAASIEVLLEIDGQIVGRTRANGSRPDLTPWLGSGDHGFFFATPALSAGEHTIRVWGVDTLGVTTSLGVRSIRF